MLLFGPPGIAAGMLNFVVFDADGLTAGNFPPRQAHCHGPDDLPLQADITFSDGAVQCVAMVNHSVALSVQFEVGKPDQMVAGSFSPTLSQEPQSLGLLTIPTCLLPSRDEPYLLTLELARQRIMLFLNKLEDWGMFDLAAEHPVMRQFETARQSFTAALVAQRDPSDGAARGGYSPVADRLAAKTIAIAIDAGEGLALAHADRQMRARLGGQVYKHAAEHYTKLTQDTPAPGSPIVVPGSGHAVLPGPPQVGVAISPDSWNENLQRVLPQLCDFITVPMRWVDLEPVEGKLSFAPTDRWIEWAIRTGKVPVHAGPLMDFRPTAVPEWIYIWENDYETLRDLVIEHMSKIVTRYRKTITRWTVASGLNVNTNFKISFEQVMDLTRVAVLLVKKLHPQGKIQLEITQPWGEYHCFNKRSLPPLLYTEAVMQTGLQIDSLALRLQMGHAQPGLSTRDMMTLSALLDRYAMFEKPISISAIGAPSIQIPAQPYAPRAGAATEGSHEPGYWRAPWSDAQQAEWLMQAMTICCSKPYVSSVCWHDLADPALGSPGAANPPEMPGGGLISGTGQIKPAAQRLAQLRQALREGRSPLTIRSV